MKGLIEKYKRNLDELEEDLNNGVYHTTKSFIKGSECAENYAIFIADLETLPDNSEALKEAYQQGYNDGANAAATDILNSKNR